MYVSATSSRFSFGRSTPAIRGKSFLLRHHSSRRVASSARTARRRARPWPRTPLALTLLVARVLANDAHDAFAPHDLALLAQLLDRCPDLHRNLHSRTRTARPPVTCTGT